MTGTVFLSALMGWIGLIAAAVMGQTAMHCIATLVVTSGATCAAIGVELAFEMAVDHLIGRG